MRIPDVQMATQFLTALGGPGAQFGFATFDDPGADKRLAHRLYGDLKSAVRLTGKKAGLRVSTASFSQYMQGHGAGIFVTVNQPDGAGVKAENITAVRALIADADSAEQVTSLRRFIAETGLTPSIVVESGGLAIGPDGGLVPKLQCYWRVEGCPISEYTAAQETLIERTGCDPATKDLPRVLRLPGFYHKKVEPRMTRLIESNDIIYDYGNIMRRIRVARRVQTVPHVAPGTCRTGQATGTAMPPQTRDQFRALVAAHGGQLRPAVRDMLAAARGPGDEGGGTREHTLVTLTGALVALRLARLGHPRRADPARKRVMGRA